MVFLKEKNQYGVVHFVTLDDIELISGFVQADIERRQAEALSAEQSSYSHVAVYDFPSQSKQTPGASSSSRDHAFHRQEEWQASSSTSAYDTSAPYATTHHHTPSSAYSATHWQGGGDWQDNRRSTWTERQDAWVDTRAWNNTRNPYTWDVAWDGYGQARNPRDTFRQFPFKGKSRNTKGDAREQFQ